MTKILFTVTTDLNYDQRMQRICTALSEEGYDVKLIGRKLKSSNPLLATTHYQQKRLNCFFQKGKFFYIEFNIRLFFYLLFQKADIICGIDLDTILPAFLVSTLKRKKFVYDAHEYFTESANLIHRKREQRIWKRVERFTVPKLKYAYTVNQSIADVFKKEYDVDFRVIRNVPYYRHVDQIEKEKLIVYQGAVRNERGLHQLVKAMKHVDGKLIIAGGGELLPELKQLASDIGVAGNIEFTGQLTPEALTEMTKKAYIGISPLTPAGFNHLYSLSNKFLEYIQLEIPQVAMNFAEYQRINDTFGVAELIDDVTPENFARAIHRLCNDQLLYNQLQQGTRKAKEELNWEKEKVVLIDFYTQVKIG